ncbi:MAG: SRPBCC domain-containing protein [Solirubrobacterales bacterium]
MAADSVEREILIEAPPKVVWGVITEPDQISRWFSDAAEVEPLAGASGALIWRAGGRGANNDSDATYAIHVVSAERYRRFSFRWNHPEGVEPDEHNSALVEFILTEEAGRTRLRVIESGIDAVTHDDEDKARYLEGHERGWAKHLGELLDYVISNQRGATH